MCQASATKSMDIVPFAKVFDCRPADIQDMLGHFRRRLRALGVRAGSMQYKIMVLATSFCVALGWTYAFLEILDIAPVPWTAAYEHALRSRLMGAWASGSPLFHVHRDAGPWRYEPRARALPLFALRTSCRLFSSQALRISCRHLLPLPPPSPSTTTPRIHLLLSLIFRYLRRE